MPYTTPLPDTLLVDSTDLQSLAGVVFAEDALSGLFAPGVRRGSNDPIAGSPGELGARKPLDAFTFTIPVTVKPSNDTDDLQDSRSQTIANYAALLAAIAGADGLVQLTRRLSNSSTTHVDATAAGEFLGAANLHFPDLDTIQVDLQFKNLNGYWLDPATSNRLVP